MKALITILFAISSILADHTKYDGHKVYHVYPKTEDEANLLHTLENDRNFDFWTHSRIKGVSTDIMVNPTAQGEFENFLKNNGIKYTMKIDNVETLIENERQLIAKKKYMGRITFDTYHRHGDINNYLRDLEKRYPEIVSLELMGKSYEGRDMLVIKISSGGNGNKPLILIDGGIHAREWIAPATVLYIINELVTNPENQHLYQNVDWYLLPVLNPDGYEYTHTNTRLWRKTRSPGTKCIGTDANRNFDYYFGTVGTSSDECSDSYKGPKAFSEIEARNLALFGQKYSRNLKLYISFHSYGQLLLYPWGYKDSPGPNGDAQQKLGDAVKYAISKVNGTEYTVGYSYKAIYPTSGDTTDWFIGTLNIPFTYTIELPDHGYGFLLPPSHILPVVQETFEGMKVFGNNMYKLYH